MDEAFLEDSDDMCDDAKESTTIKSQQKHANQNKNQNKPKRRRVGFVEVKHQNNPFCASLFVASP